MPASRPNGGNHALDISFYLQLIVQKLNAAAPGSFTPTLEQLDALIESLEVKGL